MILEILKVELIDEIINSIKHKYNNEILDFLVKKTDTKTYLIITGNISVITEEFLSTIDGCELVMNSLKESYYFTSKKYKNNTEIKIMNQVIGNGDLTIIAGPCTIEDYDSLYKTAVQLKEAGVSVFRAMHKKPRTTPYNFQGVGQRGMEYMKRIRKELNIPVIMEVMDKEDIEMAKDGIDIIQIGSRNMQNYELIKCAAKSGIPTVLKKGLWCNNEQLLKAAEYFLAYGNENVILCERGIQTHENMTRNTLDLSCVPIFKNMTHLPVMIDPSHGTGRRDLIIPMSKAAVLLGADCLEIEVHIDPEKTIKPGDGYQTINIEHYKELLEEIKPILKMQNRKINGVK